MRILGVETSCDETSVALLEVRGGSARVKKETTASQVLTHAKFGGVVPEVAARKHVEALPLILRKMRLSADDVDGVAVTRGPGLITSLRVGVDMARSLAYGWGKPVVGINHIEGHVAANFIGGELPTRDSNVFPAVVLVVSGGHTELVLMKGFGVYERLGATKDDAVGEAFDKVAKMLGLGYPGGPAVSKRAERGDPARFDLPRPMLSGQNLDFSFSGLKTAVLYKVQEPGPGSSSGRKKETFVDDMCASFEAAAVEVLVKKTLLAVKRSGAGTVMLAGGVAANRRLREELTEACRASSVVCRVPDLKYTTDNAAMIAMAGWFRRKEMRTGNWKGMEPDPNWKLGA